MTPSARISVAIEILADLETNRRPAPEALKHWGLMHRFAGSKDRAALAALVYDALRVRASAAWIMGEETPRAIILGSLREMRGLDGAAIAALCSGEGHAPAPLTQAEADRLADADLKDAPLWVAGNFPEWLAPSFIATYGDEALEEARALAARAPLDIRVNTIKATREKIMRSLAHLDPQLTPHSAVGLRFALAQDGRGPSLAAEPAHVKGMIEVQDEGSQLAALLSCAAPGEQVLDLCAGSGGKSLALAAMMENKGQIYATDKDGRRLMPIYDRLERSGSRNVQVRAPRGTSDILGDLAGRCDLVMVDAPCTGSGTWRRNPDAKWRMRPGALELRMKEQTEVLEEAARFVKPGGRIVYITCSLLVEENENQIAGFLDRHADFAVVAPAELAAKAGLGQLAALSPVMDRAGAGLRLSPLKTGTDGFFIVAIVKQTTALSQ